MQVLIADQDQVTELLPMGECIDLMADALGMLAEGDVRLPLRTMLLLPNERNLLALMPAYLGEIEAVGVKIITAFPTNQGSAYDSHQGVVLLFDSAYGVLRAIVDATSVTAIRTAAVSGVATRLLARPDASTLALVGSGTQAYTHLAAMLQVRPIRRVRVYSRSFAHAVNFAERESQRHGVEIEPVETAQAAVEGADIICTTTTSLEPVVYGDWIAEGAHVNAVGASRAMARELDSSAVVKARLYVDRRESTLNEAGDFLIPKGEGLIGDDHIAGELGELLLGQVPGRTAPEQITLFKSLGIAIEDLAAAHYIWQKAQQAGQGTWLEIGGRHFGTG